MISEVLFFIATICLIMVVVVLLIMFANFANQVGADDNEIDVGLCYRHYQEACDRLNQLKILQIINETRELWK
jgi:hypothetical protein